MDAAPSTAAAVGDPAVLTAARGLLRDADAETTVVRHRTVALADATDWRSRATDAYRAGVADLVEDLSRLLRLIDLADGELAAAQRDAGRSGFAWWP